MADRDEKGRFIKGHKLAIGNRGGSGRPPDKYKKIIASTVSFADWKIVIQKALEQAKNGDDKARKFLADYLAGSPQQFLDITTGGEKIIYTPLDEMNVEQRKEYFSKLSIALSRDQGSIDMENTASEEE